MGGGGEALSRLDARVGAERADRDEKYTYRPLKWLSVVDVLVELFMIRGVPAHIRSDNGPEFIATALRRMATLTGVENLYIEPGAPPPAWRPLHAASR